MTAGAAADWGRVAAAYHWQVPLERRALAAAVSLAGPHRDDDWLDVGTGTAALLRELAARHDPPRRVTGVDASAAMLARAPALPPHWTLAQADGRRLPFPDASFSVLTCAYLLHVVDAPDRTRIVAECARVLRPGGRLVTVTPTWPRTRLGRLLYAPLAAAARSAAGPAAGLRPLDPSQDLQEAGLSITATRYVGRGYPSLCVCSRVRP